MAVINAVPTYNGLDLILKHILGQVPDVQASYFRIGEGGFVNTGGSDIPDTPDPTRTRIVSDGDALSGTLTFTNGSATVNGDISTQFLSEVVPGQYIRLDADLLWVEVQTVDANNQITLTSNYAGTAAVPGSGSVITVPYRIFQKTFVAGDFTIEATGQGSIVAFIDFSEGNGSGYAGGDPTYFEVGVFDANDELIVYGTFPGELKTAAFQLNKIVRLTFAECEA